jgi:hypothetical protein
MEYNLFSTPEILLFFHIRKALQRRLNFTLFFAIQVVAMLHPLSM